MPVIGTGFAKICYATHHPIEGDFRRSFGNELVMPRVVMSLKNHSNMKKHFVLMDYFLDDTHERHTQIQ